MTVEIRTQTVKPVRQTFGHLARRFGDKPATRYQEATYDIQSEVNHHYKPLWDPERDLYDKRRTAVEMADWYALKDPRQYYYNTYTQARARQQDTADANFGFVESRGLVDMLPDDLRQVALDLLLPLRHAAWGANLNNTLICGYGYGVTFTQPCMFQAMDNLGIAQYLSRLGLLFGGVEALDAGKRAWLEGASWQPLRRYVEDSLVVRDPFELFVAQNVALDGLLYPLVYERIVDDELSVRGASTIAMLTQFMSEWFAETRRWVDAVLKVAAAESTGNRDLLAEWTRVWSDRAASALEPVAAIVLEGRAADAVEEQRLALRARLRSSGVEF